MPTVTIRLFGKFCAHAQEQVLEGLAACKVQELFCYLLLHRDRPHPRETLAGLLWEDAPTIQSKKYLRQTLWQLQTALDTPPVDPAGQVLEVEAEWVQFRPAADLWLDVAVFEQAYSRSQGVPGEQFDAATAETVHAAVALYRGDLLEGQYQDWCLYERERLQQMYLTLLDKLVSFHTAGQAYERALAYGTRILRYDRAHERTHRQLMRLHYLAGDRAAALRQYARCRAALTQELGVPPARTTVALYEQIRAHQLDALPPPARPLPAVPVPAVPPAPAHLLPSLLTRLHQMQTTLADLQQQVQHNIQAIERDLSRHD
jgi:DNA-binding SARP family transcriptional activator